MAASAVYMLIVVILTSGSCSGNLNADAERIAEKYGIQTNEATFEYIYCRNLVRVIEPGAIHVVHGQEHVIVTEIFKPLMIIT